MGQRSFQTTKPEHGRHALTDHALAVILAGGRGSRLKSLTDHQAKPAVPFGGRYRIVDFTLSNCLNSGFRRLHVLTQYQAGSLSLYLRGWEGLLDADKGEYIDILPADPENGKIYENTADAVYKNIDILQQHPSEWVLILAGDHIYKMDYGAMLEEHVRTGADVTIPCNEVPRESAGAFGIMHVDRNNRILDFIEKPANPPSIPGNPKMSLASMGIYIFNTRFLYDVLKSDAQNIHSSHDFGTDIIPDIVGKAKVMAHKFADSSIYNGHDKSAYWRDVGTVEAYWAANMDIASPPAPLDVVNPKWPIYTGSAHLPRPQLNGRTKCAARNHNVITEGCVIHDCALRHSLLSENVYIDRGADIEESILLPDVKVGRNVTLKKTVVESGCSLPDGLVIGQDPEEDARRFYRTPNGIVLVNQDALKRLS